jgi:geranylgeranyl pyrophosphate synthase
MSEISHLLSLVADDIKHVEDKMRSGVAERYPDLAAVVDYLMGAGGKRLRPVLTVIASRFYQVDSDKVHCLAAAVELLHTATLVHDDLIDNALLRRGMPTLNASWTAGTTILTGDYLFARAAELSADTGEIRIVKLFAQTLMTLVSGELQQLFNDGHDHVPTRAEYDQRIYSKTASLFTVGIQGVAVLGKSSVVEEEALRSYAIHLGKAFQIVDDILDFQGDEDVVGKPVANDLRQGIATLPVMIFAQQSPNHPTIRKAVRREPVTDDEIGEIVEAIRASGAIQTTMEEARRLAQQAQADLAVLPDNQYRQAMHAIADYAVARNV